MMSSSFLAPLLLIAAIFGLFGMAKAVTIDDFTKLNTTGSGFCADSKGNIFTEAAPPLQTYTNDVDMLNYCLSYCGQHLPTTFRGFETFHDPTKTTFGCECRFDMPSLSGDITNTFPYNYTPAILQAGGHPGTGAITGTRPFPYAECYKFNGNATEAPTKAPTAPSKSPSKSPSTSPSKTISASPSKASTVPATKAPTKPGSCPVGHRSCAGAADCSGSGFSHCVDGCCANIGSKSAKGTKSSKSV